MKTLTIIFSSLSIIGILTLTSCSNKQKPTDNAMDKAIVFLDEVKIDQAIEQFNLVIGKNTDSI